MPGKTIDALAHALKLTDEADLLLVNISGRGDKDLAQAQTLIGLGTQG